MWDENEILNYLKVHLKEKRYTHTLGVVETSEKLAIINNVDIKKARIAALVHDSGKYRNNEEILVILKEQNVPVDDVVLKNPQIMHGYVSAYIGKTLMNIEDQSILNAIIYHTTGKENMSALEKIIYLADYIEPSRSFPGVEELRNLSFEDLDKGVLMALDNTIKYVIDRGELLHIDTVKARNYILEQSSR